MVGIPKIAAEDTSFTFSNASGQTTTVPVPKDTRVVLCTPALHYNRALFSFAFVFLFVYLYLDFRNRGVDSKRGWEDRARSPHTRAWKPSPHVAHAHADVETWV